MNIKNKKILLFLLAVLIILPIVVYAQGTIPTTGSAQLDTILRNFRRVARGIGASMAVIGFCVAGILYLMSAGSPEKTGIAKKALIAAVIGTAVVVLAMAANVIINIFNNLLGV